MSISEEGYETYRNSVQAKQQAPTYDRLIEQRKALEDVKYGKNPNKFEEDPEQHQKAKTIINEWQGQAVRKAAPNWQIGDPIKQGVLDSITREDVEKGLQISGSKFVKSSINYTIWGQI